MKTQTKKIWTTLLFACVALCAAFAITAFSPLNNAFQKVKASESENYLGKTMFSVSTDEDNILFVAPLTCDDSDIAAIYEVGYAFNGDEPTVVNGETKKYYTSLSINGASKTAKDIFGEEFAENAPMIIWEVKNETEKTLVAKPYYKKGTVVEGALYSDYNGTPDEVVYGEERTAKIYTVTVTSNDETSGTVDATAVKVAHGTSISVSENTLTVGSNTVTATKNTDNDAYTYAFGGFDTTDSIVTSDITVTANFTKTVTEAVKTVVDKVQTFIDGYTGINLEKLKTVQASISSLDSEIATLTENQQTAVSNMAKYNEIKSSFLVVDDVKGTDVNSRFTVYNAAGVINNGETAPNVASALNHPIYGPCATVGICVGYVSFKWNNPDNIDLSGYDRVLVGIRNGTTAVQNWMLKDDSKGAVYIAKNVPASMATDGTFCTLVLTVDEFLEGFALYNVNQNSVWLTSIIAIKGAVTNQYYYDMYKDTLNEDGITSYEGIKVIEDLRGADIADGLNMNDAVNGINNGETAPNLSAALYDGTYGPAATMGVNMSSDAVIKLSEAEKAKLDLSGYNYVYFAIKNSSAGNVAVKYGETSQQIEQGSWGIVKMTVEQFLNDGIVISKTQQGSIWLAPIIAGK